MTAVNGELTGGYAPLRAQVASAPEDNVNHPKHYTSHPSGIEAIRILRHMPGNIFAAMKYCWRYNDKNGTVDLRKAIWHIADQIDLLEGNSDKPEAWGEQLKRAMSEIK